MYNHNFYRISIILLIDIIGNITYIRNLFSHIKEIFKFNFKQIYTPTSFKKNKASHPISKAILRELVTSLTFPYQTYTIIHGETAGRGKPAFPLFEMFEGSRLPLSGFFRLYAICD